MNKIIQGDCLEKLKEFPDNSVDSIVSDPPYELGFMGKKWDNTGIAYNVDMWRECLRVLKPGGHLLSFGGTRTYHRMACAIEDAGFEIRDQIQWLYGSGFPKSLNIGKQLQKNGINNEEYNKLGTALKPANEPICMARKPLSEKTVAENVLKWGTGGINIDESRVGTEEMGGSTMPDLRDVGAMSKEAIGIDKLSFGQNQRPAKRKEQPTYTGRFPANLIHDGSDEVVDLFPETKSGKAVVGTGKGYAENPSGIASTGIIASCFNDYGSAARFFYCAKASKSERNKGLDGFEEQEVVRQGLAGEHNNPTHKNNHPTVKPISLMRYLCRLITPKDGTVLDMFMGSGTTGIAAKLEGFNFIGIEREEDYIKIAEARINAWEEDKQEKLI